MADSIETGRVIIVGAGLGALYAALSLAPRPVVLISPDTLGSGASSAWAQGGVAAAMDAADTPHAHALDTAAAGAGTVDAVVAQLVTQQARSHIAALSSLGTPFDRDADGNYILGREAAHSFARVVRVKGDQAGREIMAALVEATRLAPHVQVIEGAMACAIVTQDGAVGGIAIKSSGLSREPATVLRGPAYLLAGGGSGGLYSLTTNPARIRGQVIGMAARAGAMIADPEFVQFHPTAIDIGQDPAPLATEALRGEGAHLINATGARFMCDLHPLAELAPRDIVARAIFAEKQAGRRPMLDTRKAVGAKIVNDFPAVSAACLAHGIDPVTQPIPVAAAAHYHMGGIATDTDGRSSLPNLWVCGEASSTGLHGANRLASNGLLEALVFARICAGSITQHLTGAPTAAPPVAVSMPPVAHAPGDALIEALRDCMTNHVGVVRDRAGLMTALQTIAALENQRTDDADFLNMTATATLITAAALQREESRGGHYRSDFPEQTPELAKRTKITLSHAMEIRAQAEDCLK